MRGDASEARGARRRRGQRREAGEGRALPSLFFPPASLNPFRYFSFRFFFLFPPVLSLETWRTTQVAAAKGNKALARDLKEGFDLLDADNSAGWSLVQRMLK